MQSLILALLVALVVPWVTARTRRAPGRTASPTGPRGSRCSARGSGTAWGSRSGARTAWRSGRGPSKILKHFYSGTRVAGETEPADEPSDRARPGQGLDPARGAGRIDRDPARRPANRFDGRDDPPGETWQVRAASNEYLIADQAGGTVDRVGGPSDPIYLVYGSPDSGAHPRGGHTYNRGSIEFALYSCAGGCAMRLVLTVDPQGYLRPPRRGSEPWPMSALKTQAIAARTYAFTKAVVSQHRAVCDCALYASSYDQVYAGWDKEGGSTVTAGSPRWTRRAIRWC